MPRDLLEDLASGTGRYISDLRLAACRHEMLPRLEALSAGDYSAEKWSEAASYLLGTQTQFSSPEEAKSFLLHNLP